jgi:predicted RNA-binding protein YlxR (DUF448 family)
VAVTQSGAVSMSAVVTRTCVGCRRREAATALLRVVEGPAQTVVPDPRRRASGRGAWVHPVLECVELAERRRAFGRALRIATPVDPTAIRQYVESLAELAVPRGRLQPG